MIPLKHCSTFARELLGGRFGGVLIPVCLRLVRGERSCLSMAAVDSCVFGLESMRGMAHTLNIEAIEVRVGELGGRAHFGKVAALTFRAYDFDCLPQFRAYRRERDPEGRFLTPFLAGLIRERELLGQDEFSAVVDARFESRQRSVSFSVLAWISIIFALVGVCVCSGDANGDSVDDDNEDQFEDDYYDYSSRDGGEQRGANGFGTGGKFKVGVRRTLFLLPMQSRLAGRREHVPLLSNRSRLLVCGRQ
jgi:hypothetical protein